eukprot:1156747-Pelagomonas_calceolata.AAC.5
MPSPAGCCSWSAHVYCVSVLGCLGHSPWHCHPAAAAAALLTGVPAFVLASHPAALRLQPCCQPPASPKGRLGGHLQERFQVSLRFKRNDPVPKIWDWDSWQWCTGKLPASFCTKSTVEGGVFPCNEVEVMKLLSTKKSCLSYNRILK